MSDLNINIQLLIIKYILVINWLLKLNIFSFSFLVNKNLNFSFGVSFKKFIQD